MQQDKGRSGRESAVSETIGAVMLISVVVVAVAIIGVVLTSQPPPQTLPAVSAVISSSGNDIHIYHDGGDSLKSDELSILVNGAAVPFTKGGNPAPWTWSVGDTLSYTMGSGTPETVRMVYTPGSYTIASADFRAMGSGPVTTSVTTLTPTPSTAPTVTGINPPGGNTGMTVGITIIGTNFVSGASARLTRSGYPDIPVSGPIVVSSSQMTGTVSLAGAAVGSWNVVVTNPDTQYGSLPNGFSVTNAAPAVTGITPSAGSQGTIVTVTDLAGTDFMSGATVRLNRTDSTAIPAASVVVVSPDRITCEFTLTSGTTAGAWDVIVRNPDGQEGTLTNGFTVTRPSPAVTAILPPSAGQAVSVPVSVAGTNFLTGANVTLNRTGYPDITATSVNVISSNIITCQFNTLAAAPGAWDVVVTNPDGTSGSLPGGFTVMLPAPAVLSITPGSGYRGWPVSITNLAGSNFVSGATVKLNRTGYPDIDATSVNVIISSQITCTFDLDGVQTGPWNVVVTNPDGQAAMLVNAFTVLSPAPTLSSRTPTSGNRGWPRDVTFTGTRFQPGATCTLTRSGQPDIIGTNVIVPSSSSMTCTFDLLNVYVGSGTTGSSTWNVVVTNSDGQSVTRNTWFTVYSYRPSVSTCSPNSGARGTTVSITQSGNYFQPGATVQYTRGGTTLTLINVNVVSLTQITGDLMIPAGATTGQYTAIVTNTDGRTRSRSNTFRVT